MSTKRRRQGTSVALRESRFASRFQDFERAHTFSTMSQEASGPTSRASMPLIVSAAEEIV